MSATQPKRNSLSREQAASIYEDLRKNFAAYTGAQSKGGKSAPNPAKTLGSIRPKTMAAQSAYTAHEGAAPTVSTEEQILAMMLAKKADKSGNKLAISLVLAAAAIKLAIGVIDYTGVLGVEEANANMKIGTKDISQANFSSEQIALLKALDGRRIELEERRKTLEKREEEINNRDREFAIKLAELRELNQSLKGNREAENKKKTAQLDQLSNVYGSMDPKEAALLIEQLDEPIAIELLNRMPEKRIGQILSLMNKEKALAMTKMLSGKIS